MPAPSVVYPDLVKAARANSRAPSCAEIAAGVQGLMVNRMAAAWACAMLNDFLIARSLRYFAVAFDLNWGRTRAWTIDAPTLAEATGLREADLKARAAPARA